jgi:signal transduction histidine kinase
MTSLRTKLILGFLAVSAVGIAIGLAFAALSASGEFRRFMFSRNRDVLAARLAEYHSLHGGWEGVGTQFEAPLPAPAEAGFPVPVPGTFTLVDGGGVVVVGGPGFEPGDSIRLLPAQGSVPIVGEAGPIGWLMVSGDAFRPMGDETQLYNRVGTTLAVGALTALAVALACGALVARSLTRPLRALKAATQAVAAGDFERMVRVSSRDELGSLAESFNRMSAALAEAQQLRRRMTADIAHELRTPLSIILGHLDAIDDGVLTGSAETTRIIREETERLSRLVEDLRTLTRADAGDLALLRRPVDLEQLVQHVLAAYQPQARAKEIDLQAEVGPGLTPIEIDRDRMVQVISNLLSNALFHTPAQGRVVVKGEALPSGARLSVRDSGPGIPPEDLARVFDRFYRTDKSRRREEGGSGLGLAIARSIVEAHGGRIWAESRPGEGATILIELPGSSPLADRGEGAGD